MHALVGQNVCCIPAHKKDFYFRLNLFYCIVNFSPVLLWHHNIKNNKIDGVSRLLEFSDRFPSVSGLDYDVSELLEDLLGKLANAGVVFPDENCL